MKRLIKAVISGISTAAHYWWAGVIYMAAGVDITDPAERQKTGLGGPGKSDAL